MGNAVLSRTADAARGERASTKHGRRARQPPTAPGSDALSFSRSSLRTATPSSVASRAGRRGSIAAGDRGQRAGACMALGAADAGRRGARGGGHVETMGAAPDPSAMGVRQVRFFSRMAH